MERRTNRMPSGRVRRPAAVTLAGLVTVAGVLAGCQSEGTPSATTSPSASVTSASPSPSASSPSPSASSSVVIPADARVKSDKGAEAFVRYFFDQVNTAWMEPRPGLIASMSSRSCDFCATTEQAAQALAGAGQKYRTKPVSVRSVDVIAGAPEGQQYLYVDMVQNRSDVVDASGKVVTTDRRKDIPSNVAVLWSDGTWRMHAVEQTT